MTPVKSITDIILLSFLTDADPQNTTINFYTKKIECLYNIH